MIINEDKESGSRSIANLVAINSIKSRLKQESMKRSAQVLQTDVHALMIKCKNAEEMQTVMMQKEVIASATEFILGAIFENRKSAKTFMCSYLISNFPDALQLNSKNELESILIDAAVAMQKALTNFLKSPNDSAELKGFFKVYCQIFESWRSKDLPELEDSLMEQYLEQEMILKAASDTPATMREWLPHVRKHQAQIRKKLRQVGGQKALEKLEAKLTEQEKQEKEVLEEREPVQVEHIVVGKLPKENVKIVHELYLDPEYIDKVTKDLDAPSSTLDFDHIVGLPAEDKIELVMAIRDSLIALCPSKEESTIMEELDVEQVRMQIEKNCFEWDKFVDYLLSMMEQYCSPERDAEIERLKEEPNCQEIIQMIFVMKEDLTRANLMILKKQLEAEPSTVLGYEQQWFESNFKEDEHSGTERFLKLAYKHYLEKGEKYPTNEVLSILNFALAHYVVYSNEYLCSNAGIVETMALDQERISDWRLQIRMIIESSAKTLITRNNNDGKVVDATPVRKLLEKRLFENLVKSIGGSNGSSSNSPTDFGKLGFKAHEDELKKLSASVAAFANFHRQVHGETYSRLIAKIREDDQ